MGMGTFEGEGAVRVVWTTHERSSVAPECYIQDTQRKDSSNARECVLYV